MSLYCLLARVHRYTPLCLLKLMHWIDRYIFPGPGIRAADAGLQSLTTIGIFVLSGLGLRRGEALRALSAWGAILFGFASILFITPLAAVAVLRLPLGSPELLFGLAVFCCMPTTLSSGVSLTQVDHRRRSISQPTATYLGVLEKCFIFWLCGVSFLKCCSALRASRRCSAIIMHLILPTIVATCPHFCVCVSPEDAPPCQAVGGNAALALLLTVGTNLAGIFTMPFMLCWLLGTGDSAVSLSPLPLLRSLLRTILAPLLVGAAARAFVPGGVTVSYPFQLFSIRHSCSSLQKTNVTMVKMCMDAGMARLGDNNKKVLALVSASLLALVPWMQISRAVSSNVHVGVAELALVVAAGVVVHLAYLVFNTAAVELLRIGGPPGEACASQSLILHIDTPGLSREHSSLPAEVPLSTACQS